MSESNKIVLKWRREGPIRAGSHYVEAGRLTQPNLTHREGFTIFLATEDLTRLDGLWWAPIELEHVVLIQPAAVAGCEVKILEAVGCLNGWEVVALKNIGKHEVAVLMVRHTDRDIAVSVFNAAAESLKGIYDDRPE